MRKYKVLQVLISTPKTLSSTRIQFKIHDKANVPFNRKIDQASRIEDEEKVFFFSKILIIHLLTVIIENV